MERIKKDKFVCALVAILIVLIVLLIISIMMGPKYDQELLDELNKNYELIKSDTSYMGNNIVGSSLLDNTISNEINKRNPTHMTVKISSHTYKVIGKIKIDKLGIEYPIISETTDEYLKLAPTKVCGPVINSVGNLCIAGHNYLNGRLFSRLNELKKGDKVLLTDNNNKTLEYTVYDKFKAKQDDLSALNQDTNFETELTLITCTNNVEDRLIVKCRVME